MGDLRIIDSVCRKIKMSDAFEMIFLMNPIWKIDLENRLDICNKIYILDIYTWPEEI